MVKINLKILLSVIVVLALSIAGCNKVKELLDIKFDVDFKVDMSVEAGDSGCEGGAFSVEKTIDPLADDDVKKYIDNIKGWEVTQLSLLFKQVSPDFYLSEGLVKLSHQETEVIWNLDDQQIKENTEIFLANDNGQWQKVNEIMNKKEAFKVFFSGKADPGSDFVLQLVINSKITANPL